MKTFFGKKYCYIFSIVFVLIYVAIAVSVALTSGNVGNIVFWIIACVVFAFWFPMFLMSIAKNTSVIFQDNNVTNNVMDFLSDKTPFWGWTVDLKQIKQVEYLNKRQLLEYFDKSRAKSGILLKLEDGDIRYIAADNFTHRQINEIIIRLKDKGAEEW